jgi:glutathione synthase
MLEVGGANFYNQFAFRAPTRPEVVISMRLTIVMDPLASLKLERDATTLILREADRRGHEVRHVHPSGLGYASDRVRLRGRRVRVAEDPAGPFEVGPDQTWDGDEIDAVLIRTDPPFDSDYLWVTHLLDLLPPRVFVMNAPRGLRTANEKLAALVFPDLCPAACVSQSLDELEDFRRSVGGSMVVKPLDGHAGRGVLLIRPDDPNGSALVEMLTSSGRVKVIVQEVVPDAEQGDKRVLMLNGQPLGAMLRRNQRGRFTHNIGAGGTPYRTTLTPAELGICERVGPWLVENGLYFVGLDLLGERLIEINVTSPGGLREIDELEGRALEREILDFVEQAAARAQSSSAAGSPRTL